MSGAKIAWHYPGGAGFQWEMCDLSRRRFNVWEGLDLLDEKTLQSLNKRTEISTRASASSAELSCASFRQQRSSKN